MKSNKSFFLVCVMALSANAFCRQNLFTDLLSPGAFAQDAFISPISEGLIIPALNGGETFVRAEDVFKAGIDKELKNWQSGEATPEISPLTCEIKGDGTFFQIFTAIDTDLEKSVMLPAQIIYFCESYPGWLGRNGTFFLTKKDGKYRPVIISIRLQGLYAYLGEITMESVWLGKFHFRVVVPVPTIP